MVGGGAKKISVICEVVFVCATAVRWGFRREEKEG
jgi:hypothetical protein